MRTIADLTPEQRRLARFERRDVRRLNRKLRRKEALLRFLRQLGLGKAVKG